jgi:hypothetical protein
MLSFATLLRFVLFRGGEMRSAKLCAALACAATLVSVTACSKGGSSSGGTGAIPVVPQSVAVASNGVHVQPVKSGYLRGDETGLRLWGAQPQDIQVSTGQPDTQQTIVVTSSDPAVLKVIPSERPGTFALQALTRPDPASKCGTCRVVTPGTVALSIVVTPPDGRVVKFSVPVRIDHKIIYISANPNPNPSIGGIDALLQYYDDNAAPSVIWDDFNLRNINSIYNVEGLAVGGDGTLYVANTGDLGSHGSVTEYPSGTANSVPAQTLNAPLLLAPQAVAVDASGNVFVADSSWHETLTRFPVGGDPVTLLNNWPAGSLLSGVAVDANGHLTVSMTDSGQYQSPGHTNVGALAVESSTFDTNASPILQINSTGSNGVNEPYGAAIDADGNLYVVNDYVSIVNGPPGPGPTHSTLTRYSHGLTNASQLPDATVSAGLAWPLSVAVDAAGTVYVANNTIPNGHTPGSMLVQTYAAGFASDAQPLSTINLSKSLSAPYTNALLNIQGIAVYPGPLQK